MKTYVLISRHDTEMGETICSLSQLELYEKMKAEYDEGKKRVGAKLSCLIRFML